MASIKGVVAFYRSGSISDPCVIDIPTFVDGQKLARQIKEACPELAPHEIVFQLAREVINLHGHWAKIKPGQRATRALRKIELWADALCILSGMNYVLVGYKVVQRFGEEQYAFNMWGYLTGGYKDEFILKLPEGRAQIDLFLKAA
ncbi:hypothetical protein [Methylorubrum extorquens]